MQDRRPQPLDISIIKKPRKMSQFPPSSNYSNPTSSQTSFNKMVSYSQYDSPIKRTTSNMSFIFEQIDTLQKQCRICLDMEENTDEGKKFISPCKCTGSVKYVHDSCLAQWIYKTLSQNQLAKLSSKNLHFVNCQMCKSQIKFKTINTKQCLTSEQTKNKIKLTPWRFSMLLLLFFSMLGGSIGTAFVLANSVEQSNQSQNQHAGGIYSIQNLFQISALVIMGISFFICLYFLIFMYFVGQKKLIQLAKNSNQNKNQNQSQSIKQKSIQNSRKSIKSKKQFTMATIHPQLPQQ